MGSMPNRRGHRRRWLWLAAVGGAILVASAVYVAAKLTDKTGNKPPDVATLIGMPVAIAGLVVAVCMWATACTAWCRP
ncbi:hypothetical protein, partial [Kitasatospora sp. NPDC056800]|uniref:hypothetical protein n=1 Tax=Kitasatospora sp. NPDC056800 TaxID=3345948 RepID=UPI0036B8E947